MWLVILMIKLIFQINYFYLIHKFRGFDSIKYSKTQLHKIEQSGGFLGTLLGPLLKTGLPLTKNVLKPLAKRTLIPLGLTASASATNTRYR